MRRLWLVLLLLVGAPVVAQETAPRPTVIVVDSSGSMAAALDGSTKLDAARDVLGELLGQWPAEAPLALVAYGHRRTGDCADIEVLADLGPPDPPALLKRLQGLRARGKTPLAASLQLAATLLPPEGGGIVLLTDGLETCDADPCALAAALKQAGVTVQVVGFGVTEDESKELACIAEAGGGLYRSAADAAALLESLDDVVEQARSEPAVVPAPAPAPVPAPAPPPEPVLLPAPVGFVAIYAGGERQLDLPVHWQVTARGNTPAFDYQGDGRGLQLTLPPGRYDVTASAANATAQQQIEVLGEPLSVTMPIAVGRLEARALPAKGQPPLTDQDRPKWVLEPLDGQGAVTDALGAQPALLLAAGRYRLAVTVDAWMVQREITIASGETLRSDLSLALGGLTLEAAVSAEDEPLTDWRGLEWRVLDGSGAAVATRSSEAQPRFLLPAGDYRAELALAGTTVGLPVSVAEGEERRKRFVVPSGTYTLTAALGPQAEVFSDWRDSLWTVTAVEAIGVAPDTALLEGMPVANPEVTLLPGRWRVTVQSGFTEATQEIVATPDGKETLRLDLDAARLSITAAPAAGQPPPLNIVFQVALLPAGGGEPGEPLSLGGSSGLMSGILPAGRWRVTVSDEQGRTAEQVVDLAAGTEASVTLELR